MRFRNKHVVAALIRTADGGGGDVIEDVFLAGLLVSQILEESDTELIVAAGNRSATINGSVTVVSSSGAIATQADAFSYASAGQITAVFPTRGIRGTEVTITGVSLRGQGASIVNCTIAGIPAEILFENVRCYLFFGERGCYATCLHCHHLVHRTCHIVGGKPGP